MCRCLIIVLCDGSILIFSGDFDIVIFDPRGDLDMNIFDPCAELVESRCGPDGDIIVNISDPLGTIRRTYHLSGGPDVDICDPSGNLMGKCVM